MTSYEIYWDDLNEEAKERLKSLYHENIDLSPLTIVDLEEDEEDEGETVSFEQSGFEDGKTILDIVDENKEVLFTGTLEECYRECERKGYKVN